VLARGPLRLLCLTHPTLSACCLRCTSHYSILSRVPSQVPLNAVNGPVLVHYLVALTGLRSSYSPIAGVSLHVLCLIAVHIYSYLVIVHTYYVYTTIFVVCASLILIIVINIYYLFSLTLRPTFFFILLHY